MRLVDIQLAGDLVESRGDPLGVRESCWVARDPLDVLVARDEPRPPRFAPMDGVLSRMAAYPG